MTELDLLRKEHRALQDRFAALSLCGGREAVAAWMMARGYATGHGDTVEDLLGELEVQAKERAQGSKLDRAHQ